jgi:hypothetical protein
MAFVDMARRFTAPTKAVARLCAFMTLWQQIFRVFGVLRG